MQHAHMLSSISFYISRLVICKLVSVLKYGLVFCGAVV